MSQEAVNGDDRWGSIREAAKQERTGGVGNQIHPIFRDAADRTMTIKVQMDPSKPERHLTVSVPGDRMLRKGLDLQSDWDALKTTDPDFKEKARALVDDFTTLAAELTEPHDPLLSKEAFMASDAGMEASIMIVAAANKEKQRRLGVVRSFRGVSSR